MGLNSGFRVWGLGFEVRGLGLGFMVLGQGFRMRVLGSGLEFRHQDSESRVNRSGSRPRSRGVSAAWIQISGSGFRVQGSDFGFRV